MGPVLIRGGVKEGNRPMLEEWPRWQDGHDMSHCMTLGEQRWKGAVPIRNTTDQTGDEPSDDKIVSAIYKLAKPLSQTHILIEL